MRAGVIGLKDMGSGLATNLIAKGFEVARFDLSETRAAALRDMCGTSTGRVAEVADRSDAVPAVVMNVDRAKSAIPGDAGSGTGTMHTNLMISMDLPEELEVPMQMASTEMQISRAGQSKCARGDNFACTRVIEEIVCAEMYREGA